MNIVYSENVGINELSAVMVLSNSLTSASKMTLTSVAGSCSPGADAASYDTILDDSELVFPVGTLLAARLFGHHAGEADGQHPFGLSGDGDTVTLRTLQGRLCNRSPIPLVMQKNLLPPT